MAEFNELFEMVLEATNADDLSSVMHDLAAANKEFARCKKSKDIEGMKDAYTIFEDAVNNLKMEIEELTPALMKSKYPALLKAVAAATAAVTVISGSVYFALSAKEDKLAKNSSYSSDPVDMHRANIEIQTLVKNKGKAMKGTLAAGAGMAVAAGAMAAKDISTDRKNQEEFGITKRKLKSIMRDVETSMKRMKKDIAKATAAQKKEKG